MTECAEVTFYRRELIKQGSANSLADVVPQGAVLTDFCVGPSGTFFATTNDGCLLTAHRVNSLLEWTAHKTFMESCHRLVVRQDMVYVMGRSFYNGRDVSRTLPAGDSQKWQSRLFLGTYKMGKGQGRKRDTVFPLGKVAGQETYLIEQRPIVSMIPTENASVTTMDLPEDDHYVVCGTDRGNIEVFRMAKNKSLHVKNFAPEGSNIPIQKVLCVPNGNSVRFALIYAGFMSSPSISNPTLQSSGYLAAYAFNAYGEQMEYVSHLCLAQPAFSPTICPVRLPKCPYAVAYFNPKSEVRTVEYIQPQIPPLNNVDLSEFDTILRNQHPLTEKMLKGVICNLQPDLASSAAAGLTGTAGVSTQADKSGPTFLAIYEGGDLVIFNSKRSLYRADNFTSTYLTSLNPQTGAFVILSTNPSRMELYEFSLLDIDMRVDALLGASMYTEALELAELKEDPDKIALVRQRYAQSLFDEKKYSQACDQFRLTIGFLEPSLVTKRFLDADRYEELAAYLEALHYAGKASAPHTSFLISIYAQRKDEAGLNAFVDTIEENYLSLFREQTPARPGKKGEAGGSKGPLPAASSKDAKDVKDAKDTPIILDVPSAVNSCYHYGFLEAAIRVAACLGSEDVAFSLLVTGGRFREALALLRVLSAGACKQCLLGSGQALLEAHPRETTDLLISLCTAYTRLPYSSLRGLTRTVTDAAGNSTEVPPLWAQALSKHEGVVQNAPDTLSADDFMGLYASEALEAEELRFLGTVFDGRPAASISRGLVHLYSELLLKRQFAEQQAQMAQETPAAQEDHEARASGEPLLVASQEKVNAFLDQICGNPQYTFDPDYLLTRCQIYHFEEGVLRLYRFKQAWVEMIRHYLIRKDMESALGVYDQMRSAIKDKGGPDQTDSVSQSIWNELLAAAVRSGDTKAAQTILDTLKDDPTVSSASVLEMVISASSGEGDSDAEGAGGAGDAGTQKSQGATLDLVYPFLRARFEKASSSLLESTRRLAASRAEREALEREVAELQKPVVYIKGTCRICGLRVDPPFIYMRCGHAFHNKCLVSGEKLCPECYPDGLGKSAPQTEAPAPRTGDGVPATLGELARALAEGREGAWE